MIILQRQAFNLVPWSLAKISKCGRSKIRYQVMLSTSESQTTYLVSQHECRYFTLFPSLNTYLDVNFQSSTDAKILPMFEVMGAKLKY